MKKRTDIKWASIVPLIGGESIGASDAMGGTLPEYVLSYTPFANHDSHYIAYLRDVKGWKGNYNFLDDVANANAVYEEVDVVNTVCPCAGLSGLSNSAKHDNPTNDWLYTTANDALSKVRPKIFWGENAPGLAQGRGKPVADKLKVIGEDHGYNLNLFLTASKYHGLAQKRARTFYFFTRKDIAKTAPILPWYLKAQEPVEEILQLKTADDDPMNIDINSKNPKENGWVAYCMHRFGVDTLKALFDKMPGTMNCICFSDRKLGQNLTEVAEWFDENNFPKNATRARAMQAKLDQDLGYWGHGVTVPKGEIPALIGPTAGNLINPFYERYITLRDALRVMKMPDDFNLTGENPISNANHIFQNVPVTTAHDMMLSVAAVLDGKCVESGHDYLYQNNGKKTISPLYVDSNETESLESFLA